MLQFKGELKTLAIDCDGNHGPEIRAVTANRSNHLARNIEINLNNQPNSKLPERAPLFV